MPLPSTNLAQFLYTIDAKNIFAEWVFSLKMFTTFCYMTLGSFILKTRWRLNKNL